MSGLDTSARLVYLAAAVCFVVGLHMMNSPATARRGNFVSGAGMCAAIIVTLVLIADGGAISATGWVVMAVGALVGSCVGLYAARSVAMTAMPQLVSLFNAVGGGAAALVGVADFVRLSEGSDITTTIAVTTVLDVIIGGVTFSGSLIAVGKLQGFISGSPVVFAGARALTAVAAIVAVGGGVYVMAGNDSVGVLILVIIAALVFGVSMVMPIGGADMPVVISLLNAFTGLAVAMAGFVVDSSAMIIGGALVGAAGSILTKLMADAMNRSIGNIIAGGFGAAAVAGAAPGAGDEAVREISADDAAIQLAYAANVIIVPGYGLAAARAQHELGELADQLKAHGVQVTYAIHPVAGRMPGHMNVLLAEADVPYTELKEMDDVNPDFAHADVALVVGANDVTNPAARRPGNVISGMPILDVDHAASVIVIKRSMSHGYADIANELFTDPKTGMFFADAKAGLSSMTAAVKTLVG